MSAVGWWVGRGSGDPCGHLLRVTSDFSRFVGQVYTPRDLTELLPVRVAALLTQVQQFRAAAQGGAAKACCCAGVRCQPQWFAVADAFKLRPLACCPPQNKVPSESEDSRARMLAALQQKQRELAGGAFNNPVRETSWLL